jgi:hypothetical protein
MFQQSHPWLLPEDAKTYVHTKTLKGMFIAALCITLKIWKQLKCPPTDEWINVAHPYNGILFSDKK